VAAMVLIVWGVRVGGRFRPLLPRFWVRVLIGVEVSCFVSSFMSLIWLSVLF